MATQTTKTPAAPKAKKAPVAPVTRIVDQLKRSALQGKISKEELDTVANLAGALKTFLAS